MIDVNSQIIYLLTGWMPSIDKENQEKPLSSNEWSVVARKLYSKDLMPKDLQSKDQDYFINERTTVPGRSQTPVDLSYLR